MALNAADCGDGGDVCEDGSGKVEAVFRKSLVFLEEGLVDKVSMRSMEVFAEGVA